MKTNELMVGDWVKVTDDDTDDSFIGQVKAIDELENINVPEGEDVAYPYSIDCLEPIPLTPEILEKSGFEKQSDYQWKYSDSGYKIVISIAPQIEIEGELLGAPPINVKMEGALFELNKTDDWYVHQLQHALRLCGIEKEITL